MALIGMDISSAQSGKRLSREELIAKRDAARGHNSRFELKEAEGETQAKAKAHPTQNNILDRSVLLSSELNWTFVPKGAVFFVPDVHQKRVYLTQDKRKGKYLPFEKFHAKNQGWLSTYSVTLEQARGKVPISENAQLAMEKSGRVVVSVCKGGPITVRPYKKKESVAKN